MIVRAWSLGRDRGWDRPQSLPLGEQASRCRTLAAVGAPGCLDAVIGERDGGINLSIPSKGGDDQVREPQATLVQTGSSVVLRGIDAGAQADLVWFSNQMGDRRRRRELFRGGSEHFRVVRTSDIAVYFRMDPSHETRDAAEQISSSWKPQLEAGAGVAPTDYVLIVECKSNSSDSWPHGLSVAPRIYLQARKSTRSPFEVLEFSDEHDTLVYLENPDHEVNVATTFLAFIRRLRRQSGELHQPNLLRARLFYISREREEPPGHQVTTTPRRLRGPNPMDRIPSTGPWGLAA
jgi:hypothetical protein